MKTLLFTEMGEQVNCPRTSLVKGKGLTWTEFTYFCGTTHCIKAEYGTMYTVCTSHHHQQHNHQELYSTYQQSVLSFHSTGNQGQCLLPTVTSITRVCTKSTFYGIQCIQSRSLHDGIQTVNIHVCKK